VDDVKSSRGQSFQVHSTLWWSSQATPYQNKDAKASRAICRRAKHVFRSNLRSPTAHSHDMPVVRTESTPQARHEHKKRAHLSKPRTEGRKRRTLLPACRSLPSEKKLSYKSVWTERQTFIETSLGFRV